MSGQENGFLNGRPFRQMPQQKPLQQLQLVPLQLHLQVLQHNLQQKRQQKHQQEHQLVATQQ